MLKHIGAGAGGSSAAIHPGYVPGKWYQPFGSIVTTGASVTNTLYVHPCPIFHPTTLTKFGSRTNGPVSGAQIRMGLARTGSDKLPGDIVLTTPAVSAAAGPVNIEGVASPTVQIDPGFYWVLALCDGALNIFTIINTNVLLTQMIGGAAHTDAVVGLSTPKTFGDGFPPTLTGLPWTQVVTNAAPLVRFLVA